MPESQRNRHPHPPRRQRTRAAHRRDLLAGRPPRLHRFKADEAYLVGEGKGPVEAYLDVEGIVALAKEKGVDAIHPGYGFLSENPALPRACERAGITFVGPSADLLELLGDKTAARATGAEGRNSRRSRAPKSRSPTRSRPPRSRREIGFPLIIKAAFGGGGRGMRVVRQAPAISPASWKRRGAKPAPRSATTPCSWNAIIRRAKHIEVQILGDRHGNIAAPLRARLLGAAPPPEGRRSRARGRARPTIRARACRRRGAARARGRLLQRRHRRVPGRRRYRRVVLHRGESAHPGGAHRHRNGHRHRPGALPDSVAQGLDAARRRDESARAGRRFRCTATRCSAASPPRIRPTTSCPTTARSHTYRSPAGFGIRLDGGSAYGGAVITPYYDSLLVKMTAWGREFPTRLPAHGPRAARVPHPRREDEHSVPRERRQPPGFPGGQRHHALLDETPELFQFAPRRTAPPSC